MRKIVLSAFAILIIATQAFAQGRQVTGTVTFEKDGKPIAGAVVLIKGTTDAVATTRDGNYAITTPEGAKLVFQYTGLEDKEVAIGSRTRINVAMAEKDIDAGTVVVVAYGTTTKEALVGSVSTLDAATIGKQQISSVTKALEGTVPGVQVTSSSGQPGLDSGVKIRGTGSIHAGNSALIVVDGAPYSGSLSDINPADIESTTVSKDATSNSLYGSRAANGVIFVTTKKGRANTAKVSFKATVGVNQRGVPEYDIIRNEKEFYEVGWLGTRNSLWAGNTWMNGDLPASGLEASNSLLTLLGGYDSYAGSYTGHLVDPTTGKLNSEAKLLYSDKLYDAMFRAGMRQEYTLGVSGGTDRTNYYISGGYLKDEGYVRSSDYERYTLATQVNTKIKKWLAIGTSIRYTRSFADAINETAGQVSNVFRTARSWAPIFPVYSHDAEGKIKLDKKGQKIYDLGTAELMSPETSNVGSLGRPVLLNGNPMNSLIEDFRKSQIDNINTRFFAEVTFLKDFKAKVDYTFSHRATAGRTFQSPLAGDGSAVNGRITENRSTYNTSNFNQIIEYAKKIGDHSVNALIGHEYYKYDYNAIQARKTDLFDPKRPNFTSAGNMDEISAGISQLRTEGYFFSADYNYANKYYFKGSVRTDGSSRFINDRWGTFWAVGGAWRITQENFMQGSASWLNELKLRASYGTQGNQNLSSYYPGLDTYGMAYLGSGEWAWGPDAYGNPDVSWEKQKTLDIGIDFTIAKRLTGVIDFYARHTDGMLYQRFLAISSGIPYNWINLGKMRNIGIEVDLNYKIFDRADLQWSVGVNFSHNKNKVLKLPIESSSKDPVTGGLYNVSKRIMVGRDVYSWYLPTYLGVDQDTGKSIWVSKEKDADGNYLTTTEQGDVLKSMVGKSSSPDLIGGINTYFYYKGFDFSILTSFQLGGWTLDEEYLSLMGNPISSGKHRDIWKGWDPANPTRKTNTPMYSQGDMTQNERSTRFLIKASYFNIRNISVGYTFPSKWMEKIGIESIRVFAVCDNAALFSKRKGFDPRTSVSGSHSSALYSAIRTMSVGINVNF